MKGLNLSGFEKVSADKDKVKLRHKDGHEIHIALKALSPKMRTDIHALPFADGGEVADDSSEASVKRGMEQSAKGEVKSRGSFAKHVDDKAPANKDLKVEKFTPVEAEQVDDKVRLAEGGETPEKEDDFDYMVNSVKDALTPDKAAAEERFAADQASLPSSPETPEQPMPESIPPVAANEAQLADSVPINPVSVPMSPNTPEEGVNGSQSGSGNGPNVQEGFNLERSGANQEAQALAQQAKENLSSQKQAGKGLANIQQIAQDQLKHGMDQREGLTKAINSQVIDPNRVWANKSFPQKALSIIGLILGGAGASATGGHNLAGDFLDKQIERDVDQQKSELGKKFNLLDANMKIYGNLKDATDMTRIQLQDQVNNQMAQSAARAGTPMALAAAKKYIGDKEAQLSPQFMQLQMKQMLMKARQAGGTQGEAAMLPMLRALNPEAAKEIEARYVPGVGTADVPVPAEARNALLAKQQLHDAANDLLQWSQQHTGSLDPRVVAEGKQKSQLLQSLYREGVLGTVYKAGEQPLLDKVVGEDPTSFFNKLSNIPKLKEIISSNERMMNTQKQQYGLPKSEPAPQVRVMHGAQYTKVPGGWAKVK